MPANGLTIGQMQVLKGIGDGLCTKEIASNMKLSVKSVQWHQTRLFALFPRLNNQVKLAHLAIAFGLSSL